MSYTVSSILSLISRIHSQSQDFLQQELNALGLKELATSHGNILFCLSKNDQMSLGELTEKINRDKSTTTALVKKLEKEGFVNISKDKNDSRKKNSSLTEKGKNYNESTSAVSRRLLETAWNGFSESEKKQLVELLNKLSENLK